MTVFGSPDRPVLCYGHWIASHCWQIANRAQGGDSFTSPIPTDRVLSIVSEMNFCSGSQDQSRHFCSGTTMGDDGTRAYQNAYYMWIGEDGPTREPNLGDGTGTEGPGTPLHFMTDSEMLFFLDDRGGVIAFR
jgi:hypothetical protein